MIVKVKEPQPQEVALLRPHHLLFTYLHLAPAPELTRGLMESGATCIAYETVEDARGRLPLLAPMSEVAGKIATQAGAFMLEKPLGGRGHPARRRAGRRGGERDGDRRRSRRHARRADRDRDGGDGLRLRPQRSTACASSTPCSAAALDTCFATTLAIEERLPEIDLVIGAVLVHGAKAPHVITRRQLALMKPGAVLVDVSIDQGGCFETSRPTTHTDPTYEVDGVTHYCVANMPGAVPITSTHALTNATMPYVRASWPSDGFVRAVQDNPGFLKQGLNVVAGKVTYAPVAEAVRRPVRRRRAARCAREGARRGVSAVPASAVPPAQDRTRLSLARGKLCGRPAPSSRPQPDNSRTLAPSTRRPTTSQHVRKGRKPKLARCHAGPQVRQRPQDQGRRASAPWRLHACVHHHAQEAELGPSQGCSCPADSRLDGSHRLHPRRGSQPSGALGRARPRRPRQGPSGRALQGRPRHARRLRRERTARRARSHVRRQEEVEAECPAVPQQRRSGRSSRIAVHRSRLVHAGGQQGDAGRQEDRPPRRIVYDALAILAERTGRDPLEALEASLKALTPSLEVRSRRVGGATYQVPVEVQPRRSAHSCGALARPVRPPASREDDGSAARQRAARRHSRSRAAPTSARTTSTAWRRPTRPSPTTAGNTPDHTFGMYAPLTSAARCR